MTAETRDAPSAPTTPSRPPPDRGAKPAPSVYPGTWRLLAARVVSLAVLGAGVYYLYWRASTLDGTGILGLAFYAVEALNFGLLVLTAFLLWRVRKRPATPAPPRGTLDVFIPVCGEPVELVEQTLRAALAIGYPHRTYLLNDGGVASKDNWREIERLAARYDVPCLTRTTGTRGKAGNLNHALALTDGELVAVIDCDHEASPRFAHELLGYFADQRISFVTTRQEFHGDRADLLGNREPVFYTWFQPAKDAAEAAFSTGSGVVYRRTALHSVGGFSEWSIGEDFHTSTRLHAAGWTSAYHPRPVTVGVAPQTAATLVKQRLNWATDSARVLLFDNPLRIRTLTRAQRLHHFHTGVYYVVAATQLFFLVSPAIWLIWQVPVMRPDSTESYLIHSLPVAAATFGLICIWGGRRGIRTIQQELYLAPVHALGVARAATGVRFRSSVSDKALQSRFSPLTVPQQLIAALLVASIAVAFVRPSEGQAVAAAWAAFMAYSLIAFIITISGKQKIDRSVRIGLRVAVVLLAALVILPLGSRIRPQPVGAASPAWEGPLLSFSAPSSGAYVGVFNPLVLQSRDGLATWNQTHGAHARVVHFYEKWFGEGQRGFPTEMAMMVADQGAVPLITWEPLGESGGSGDGEGSPLRAIASGAHDEYIRSWAQAAAAYGRPLLLRPLHDMNGSWYPWATDAEGNSPGLYVAAWRRLHDLFAAEGAANVGWVWSVYSFEQTRSEELAPLYPGTEYVDWVSMAAFNWGEENGGTWQTADDLFGATYDTLARLGKPIMISQIATAEHGGSPQVWVRDALRKLRHDYPLVKTVVWYDARYPGDVDLRLRGAAAEAFASELRGSVYWSPEPAIAPASDQQGARDTVR